MPIAILLFTRGLLLLIKGGDWFADGPRPPAGRLSRVQGILLLAIYAAFCVLQLAA